jgi:hypothetical protein
MNLWDYILQLIKPFFNWWWAAISAVATLVSFFGMPNSITVDKVLIAIMIMVVLALIFLTFSVLTQGFQWFKKIQNPPRVVGFSPASREDELEIFRITSTTPLQPGQVMSLLRTTERATVCMAMVRVERHLENLTYQCRPLWIAPIHRRDLKEGRIHVSQLTTTTRLQESDLMTYTSEVKRRPE